MTLTEKAAYLKGLRDGMKLAADTDEHKLLNGIIDLLSDMATAVEDLDDTTLAISDELDDVEEEIDSIEEYLDEDFSFGYDDDEDDYDEDLDSYEMTCPACGETIVVSADELEEGFECPECGAKLDFDLEEDADDEDDD